MNFDINQFHFIRPLFLLLFVVLVWFVWRVYRYSQNANAWNKACDPGLLSYLLVGVEKKKGWFHLVLLTIVGTLIILAMAGPTWSKLPQAVYKKESARVFVLDLSRSMDATDLAPNRASRAKLKLIDFLEARDEGLSALVVYANNPHIVSPLTDDSNTIISMVPSLSTSIMPSSGSRADKAIMKAAQLLTQAGNTDGDIVLLTDGVNLERVSDVAQKVAAAGYTVNVIGVGTEQGAPIPTGGSGFLKDNGGSIVIPKLNRGELKSLALSGSGIYADISVGDKDIQRLQKNDIEQGLQKNKPFVREVDLWRDQGHLLLLLALPFAALGFRRGWLGSIVFVSVLSLPSQNAYALSWDDLWVNKNLQAEKAFNAGEPAAAAELFENNEWKGSAEYKAGNFEKAEAQFIKSDTAESFYNLGNSLARQGKLAEAIEAYNNTLERSPGHKDAEFNKQLVEKIKQDQESGKDNKPGDSDQNSDQEKENSDEKGDSKSDQQGEEEDQGGEQGDQKENEGDKQEDQQEGQDSADQQPKDAESQKEKDQREKAQKEANEKDEKTDEEDKKTKDTDREHKEIEQATEQWLRRIPDDPGGLLREKMRRQNLRDRGRQRTNTENQW